MVARRTTRRPTTRKTSIRRKRKLPTTVGKTMSQTGKRKSIKADKKRKALRPGRRISKTGKRYTETRRNRSDKPGSKL